MMPKVSRKVATGRLMKGAERDMAQRPPGGGEISPPPRPSPARGEGEVHRALDASPPPVRGRVRVGGAAAARTMSPPYPAARRFFAAPIGVALAGSLGFSSASPRSQRVIRVKPR